VRNTRQACGPPLGNERITVADLRIGGMALRDGVLLQSEDNWAAAVRLPDGSVKVRSGPKSRLPGRGAYHRPAGHAP
jgi:uncharacterized protein YqhQ